MHIERTTTCLELFVVLYNNVIGNYNYIAESYLAQFNKRAKHKITTQQLAEIGYFLCSSLKNKDEYFVRVNV